MGPRRLGHKAASRFLIGGDEPLQGGLLAGGKPPCRRGRAPLVEGRAAVYLILKNLCRTLFRQGPHNGGGSPREIAQLFFRGFPHILQGGVHVPLAGRQLPRKAGDQPHHFGGGILHAAGGHIHPADRPPLQQALETRAFFGNARFTGKLLGVQGAARFLQGHQHLPLQVCIAFPVKVLEARGQHIAVVHAQVQARRDHQPHSFEQGAVGAAFQPQGQFQHFSGKHRPFVQQAADFLQARRFFPARGEDYPHPFPTALAKGHQHPHAWQGAALQPGRQGIGEQLVKAVGGLLYRHLDQHPHSSSKDSGSMIW